MTAQDTSMTAEVFAPVIENGAARGRVVLVCEHASNAFPARWGTLGLTPSQRQAHIAWDPGALSLARGLAKALDAVLVHAPVSRLIYDCNRAPDQQAAMPARSEVHDIPGNAGLAPTERAARVEAIYLPFHQGLRATLARRMTLGLAPVLITVHSFTPVFHGQPRQVEFGVIHDADPTLALAILGGAAVATGLHAALNAPYSAADGVTHTLRLQATPFGLPGAMLEVRNDLIATPQAQAAWAARLAPVLADAVAALQAPAMGL